MQEDKLGEHVMGVKITKGENHISITFSIQGKGNKLILERNEIDRITKKFNPQVNFFLNTPSFRFEGSKEIPQLGSYGGAYIFHSHSCEIEKAAKVLVGFLKESGHSFETEIIVEKTHRDDGTPYKKPQNFRVVKKGMHL